MSIDPTAFIHEKALDDKGVTIGARSRAWTFTHILSSAQIGPDCNICDQVFIEGDVLVGDRVTVKCGVQLGDSLRVEEDVFIGPNVTFANDKYPLSKNWPQKQLQIVVKAGASTGGGGCDSSWTHHWREGDGGGWQCAYQVVACWSGGGGQFCAGDSPAGGGQR